MTEIGIAALFMLLVFIAYKVHDIDTRLHVIDIRHRILEGLLNLPREKRWEARYKLYDDFFGDIYVGDYDRLVKFGRKHDLKLPLKTMKEIESEPKSNEGD